MIELPRGHGHMREGLSRAKAAERQPWAIALFQIQDEIVSMAVGLKNKKCKQPLERECVRCGKKQVRFG